MRINNADGLEYEVGVLMAKAIKDENYDYELAKAMIDKFSGLDITHMAEGIEAELEGFTEATVTDVLEQFNIEKWAYKVHEGEFNDDNELEDNFQDTLQNLNDNYKAFKLEEYFDDTVTVYIGKDKDIYVCMTSENGSNGEAVLYKVSNIETVLEVTELWGKNLDIEEIDDIYCNMDSYVNSL